MRRVAVVNPSLIVERVGADYLMLTASGSEVVRATTGSGGGGGWNASTSGAGGSGVVVIRFADCPPEP